MKTSFGIWWLKRTLIIIAVWVALAEAVAHADFAPPMPPMTSDADISRARKAREMQNVGQKAHWTPSKEANVMKAWRQHPQDQPLHWQPGVKVPKPKTIRIRSPRDETNH